MSATQEDGRARSCKRFACRWTICPKVGCVAGQTVQTSVEGSGGLFLDRRRKAREPEAVLRTPDQCLSLLSRGTTMCGAVPLLATLLLAPGAEPKPEPAPAPVKEALSAYLKAVAAKDLDAMAAV